MLPFYNFLKSLVTIEDVKRLLPEGVLNTLTAQDDSVVQDALDRAVAFVYAYLVNCGRTDLNESEKPVVKAAIEKLTLYEISLYATVELPFEAQKKEATTMLEAVFGCRKGRAAAVIKNDPKTKRLKRWDVM